MMVVIGLVVTMIEDGGEIGNTAAQPVMVPGIIIARAILSIEAELSTTEVAQVAPVITILPLKPNTSRTVEEITGPTSIVVLVNTDRENMSIEDAQVPLATLGMSGEMSKIVVQPAMAPGVIIALVMMPGEEEPSTTEAVQELLVITTPQPRTNLFRTVLQGPGSIIAPAMIFGEGEQLAIVLEGAAGVQPRRNFIRTAERILGGTGVTITVKTMTSIAKERSTIEAVQVLLVLTTPIKRKRKSKSVVQVIGLTTTAAKAIGARENG